MTKYFCQTRKIIHVNKTKFPPDVTLDKLKAGLVADRVNKVDTFMTSSHRPQCLYKLSLLTIDLNAEFTLTNIPIYLKINKDMVPYWTRHHTNVLPYVSAN